MHPQRSLFANLVHQVSKVFKACLLPERQAVLPYCMFAMALLALAASVGRAQDPSAVQPDLSKLPKRELQVPVNELQVLLSSPNERVIMTRAEYEKLLSDAKLTPEAIEAARTEEQKLASLPTVAEFLVAAHQVTVDSGRATIESEYRLELFKDSWVELPLEFSNVQLLSATLDNQTAWLRKLPTDAAAAVLVCRGKGLHTLKFRSMAVAAESSAQQSIGLVLPTSSTATWSMQVPGNVEILSGAEVLNRDVDNDSNMTRFRFVPTMNPASPHSASLNLTMTLNNKSAKEQSLVDVRSQQLVHISSSVENVGVLFEIRVLQGGESRFSAEIPDGFEIQTVQSPWMARWGIETPEPDQTEKAKRLIVDFREPVTDQANILVKASRTKSGQQNTREYWRLPSWKVLGVSRHDSLVSVGLSDLLRWVDVKSQGLIPIKLETLRTLNEKLVLENSETIRPIFAGYAPRSSQQMSANLERVQTKPRADVTWVMDIAQREIKLSGTIRLTATQESLDRIDLRIPKPWRVQNVVDNLNRVVAWEKQSTNNDAEAESVSLRLQQLLRSNQTSELKLELASTPEGWLASWQENRVGFPKIEVANVDSTRTVISASARDDMNLEEAEVGALDPLLLAERTSLGLPASSVDALAYLTLSESWKLNVLVNRLQPTLIAEAVTFASSNPSGLSIQHEIVAKPERAKIDQVQFTLPESTPTEVSLRFASGAGVKSYSQTTADGLRTWTVKLPERTLEASRLLVEYRLPSSDQERLIPVPKVLNAAYQSGLIAVDRDDAMEVTVRTSLRRADIGEMTDSTLTVGSSFLGVFGYAAFQDTTPEVRLKSIMRELSYIPSTIAESMSIRSWLSNQNWSYHQASYNLRTATNKIAVRIPDDLELWAVTVDGKSALPQRDGELVIVELPIEESWLQQMWQQSTQQQTFQYNVQIPQFQQATSYSAPVPSKLRTLLLTYALPIEKLGLNASISLQYPQLVHRTSDAQTSIPVADVTWTVYTPRDFQVAKIEDGIADAKLDRTTFPWNIGNTLAEITKPIINVNRWTTTALPTSRLEEERFRAQTSLGSFSNAERPLPSASESGQAVPQPPRSESTPNAEPFGVPRNQAQSGLPAESRKLRKQSDARRSLQVAVDATDSWNAMELNGFSAQPVVSLNVVQAASWKWLAKSAAGLIVALFVMLWTQPLGKTWRAGILTLGLAVILTLTVPSSSIVSEICESVFWATIVMLSLRIIVAIVRLLRSKKLTRVGVVTALVLCVHLQIHGPLTGLAQQQPSGSNGDNNLPNEIRTVEQMLDALRRVSAGDKPLQIPMDAIVVPYASEGPKPRSSDEKLLVPLQTFEYLNSIASGKVKSSEANGPLTLGSMAYTVTLDGTDSLVLDGTVSVLNSSTEAKPIPLALASAVLLDAILDNAPASVFAAGENLVVNVPPSTRPMVLRLKVRTKITSQAGWQTVQATIPSTVATCLTATVPSKETEVRWTSGQDRQQLLTKADTEKLELGLAGGQLALQWRPKITQVVTDQSLEAQIASTIALLEDSIATDNQIQFTFRRGRRDDFLVIAPKGYRVERVVGDNVKSWKIEDSADGQQIRITLLKTAVEAEKLRIQASQQIELQSASEQEISVPTWKIPDASVTRGQFQLLAANNLSVNVLATEGLSREDVTNSPMPTEHPTTVTAISAYRYSRDDYQLTLAIRRVAAKFDSNGLIDLFVYRSELEVEALYRLNFAEGENSTVSLTLPANWKYELGASSVKLDLEVKPEIDGKIDAVIRSLEPMPKQVQFTLVGKQARDANAPLAGSEIALPQLRVLGGTGERGSIRVWTDRGLDAETADLKSLIQFGNQRGGAHRSRSSMEQKALLQFTLSASDVDKQISGRVRLHARRPIIDTISVCNAKLTKQSIEQTIYIEWLIREAGISEVSFVLPASMKQANIAAQMARSITRQPLSQDSDSPVRVTIALQDQILGEYRVLVQNDLPWSDSKSSVPLVSGMTGNVRHQFVTLENSGFDELVTGTPVGMQPLVRGDSYWNEFAKILGSERVQAYRLDDLFNVAEPFKDDQPKLTFSTRARSTVQTANAKIGLATTRLSMDAQGNYRGTVEFRMENFSEPYLEIELPSDSQVWSIYVAETPVKPGKSSSAPSNAQAQRIRIPLVRTQLGDLDYGIRLVYAGKLSISKFWSSIQLPFVKSINVQPEQSQLRLHLPPSFRWYRWEGTMGQVQDEQDLTAGWLSYRNDQLQGLSSLLAKQSSDDFSQSRAVENIKRLNDSVQQEIQAQGRGAYNSKLQEQVGKNSIVIEEARKQQTIVEQEELKVATDNRSTFGNLFMQQSNKRASGNNFLEQSGGDQSKPGSISKGQSMTDEKAADKSPKKEAYLTDPAPAGPGSQDPFSAAPPQQAALPPAPSIIPEVAPQQPFNQDRQQSDAKQLAQRYKSKIQNDQSNIQGQAGGRGGLQNSLANNFANNAAPDQNVANRSNAVPQGSFPPNTGGMAPGGGGGGRSAGNAAGMGAMGGMGGMGSGGFGGGSASTDSSRPSAPSIGGPGGMGGQSGMGGQPGMGGGADLGGMPGNNSRAAQTFANNAPQLDQVTNDFYGANETVQASGLRSLDVQVPVRGTEYLFVTPKGEMQLTAHGIAIDKVRDWALALGTLIAMILLTRRWSSK